MSILIRGGTVLTVNDSWQIHAPGHVKIEGDKIVAVGYGEPPPAVSGGSLEIIDATNMAVMPGMINAHTHLFQTFIRGLADDKPLMPWLRTTIWPVGAQMGLEEARLSALLGYVENIRSGVTAIIDNQYLHNTPETDDAYLRAAEEVGVRLLMARGWADVNYHPAFIETGDEVLERMEDLVSRWNHHPSGRIRVEFGPLAATMCSEETLQRTYERAKAWGVGMHMHIAETRDDQEHTVQDKGLRQVEWLERIGCLGPDIQMVHAVWLSDREIELAAEYDAKVVHCAVSNMYLASGVARVPEMRKHGIVVALATDGPGSNNNQDMIETLKTTALLHKVSTLDAMILQPEEVLRMACRDGARVFGQEDQIGSLEVGKKADVVLVDLNTPFAVPVHRVPSALVYNVHGSNVDTVIVNGKILMRGKEIRVLDENALLEQCRRAACSLMARAGVPL
jgi:5-methylthioadenosine/S-adenosylhomocysteine deaminase